MKCINKTELRTLIILLCVICIINEKFKCWIKSYTKSYLVFKILEYENKKYMYLKSYFLQTLSSLVDCMVNSKLEKLHKAALTPDVLNFKDECTGIFLFTSNIHLTLINLHNIYRENVRVNGFGLFLLILYPGAYVDLSSEHLQVVSPLRQLRIYCAGVWHNFVIVIFALIVIFILPILLIPFYSTGSAVVITQVSEVSLL